MPRASQAQLLTPGPVQQDDCLALPRTTAGCISQATVWVWPGKRKHLPQVVKKSWEIRISYVKLEEFCKVFTAQEHSYVDHQSVCLVWISEAVRGLRYWNSPLEGPSRNLTLFKISTVDLWTQLVHYHSKGMSSGPRISCMPWLARFPGQYYGQKPNGWGSSYK